MRAARLERSCVILDKKPPKATELYFASLVATALVYLTGVALIAALIYLTSHTGGIRNAVEFLSIFATIGVAAALFAAFVIVAPLGTAVGQLILRLTPAAWWQGPITGVLVALTLVGLTFLTLGFRSQAWDTGTYAVAAIPVVLSGFAGSYVQRRILRWPNGTALDAPSGAPSDAVTKAA